MDTTTFNLKYYKLYSLAKSRNYTILKTRIKSDSIKNGYDIRINYETQI